MKGRITADGMTRVHVVTDPLAPFDGLLDLERSRLLHAGGAPFGLERVGRLAAALGELPLPRASIHVAGSEGKTSVTERCAAGLAAAGLRAGCFTSPHLKDPLERLRVDLALPPRDAVARAVDEVLRAATRAAVEPTWFEALWATARVLFARLGLDAAVWETGLGGRLDATRLSPADVCVVTSISLEHTAVLGPTLAAVAAEKAGILRAGVPVVLGELPGEARAVLVDAAARLGCPVREVRGATGPARGTALALAALDELARAGRIPALDGPARAAVASWRVAGRDHVVGDVLFDGAHSVAAVRDLAGRLAAAGHRGPVVFGATHGRDASAMAQALLVIAEPLIVTRPPGERGQDPAALLAALPADRLELEPDPEAALVLARRRAGPGRRIVVTGSLYLVGRLLPPGSAPE